jgi:hypothetical protein
LPIRCRELARLRTALYPPLARIANRWQVALGLDDRYPAEHADLSGALPRGRPDQADTAAAAVRSPATTTACTRTCMANTCSRCRWRCCCRARDDFSGGEFVLTEQRPRMQSRVEVVPLFQGDAVVFPVHTRPVNGTRGVYRVNMRHGVSRVRSGHRHTLGIIFHDAA